MSKIDPTDLANRHAARVIESSDDAVISKDLDGIITSWNAAAARMFGYTAGEAIGQSVRMLIPPDRQEEEDEVLSRIRRGESVDHFETVRQRKDGTTVAISLTVSPIRDDAGLVMGASKVARDISERTRLIHLAAESSRMKDEFLAILSHELRTPLHAIVGYVKLMRRGALPADKQGSAVLAIERNADLLGQMIDDILDVSRIVSGKTRLDVQPLDLTLVIHNA
ncbi:MAG: PAS domain S-box protein, partial [Pseudolysinimonas sp.]